METADHDCFTKRSADPLPLGTIERVIHRDAQALAEARATVMLATLG